MKEENFGVKKYDVTRGFVGCARCGTSFLLFFHAYRARETIPLEPDERERKGTGGTFPFDLLAPVSPIDVRILAFFQASSTVSL